MYKQTKQQKTLIDFKEKKSLIVKAKPSQAVKYCRKCPNKLETAMEKAYGVHAMCDD